MTSSDICRGLIGIISKYVDPISAQFIVEKYCNNSDIPIDYLLISDVPKFILHLARERDNLTKINDNKFERLLKELIDYSNLENDNNERGQALRKQDLK